METFFVIFRIIMAIIILGGTVALFCGVLSDEATNKEKEQFKRVGGKPKINQKKIIKKETFWIIALVVWFIGIIIIYKYL